MGAAALAGGLLVTPPARGEDSGITTAFIVGLAVVATPAAVTLVGTSVQLGSDARPGLGWPIGGLVCGGLSLAGGVALMATSPQGQGRIYVPQFAGGAVDAMFGAAVITTSSLVLAKRLRMVNGATLVPLVIADARGRLVPGVGVDLGSF